MLAKCCCTCWIDVEGSTSDKAHAHKTEWLMENKADLGAVWIYDSAHRKRQGMTYSPVCWRHCETLTTVTVNGVTASECLCEMCACCVCVCVCRLHGCGESESDRQTRKQREASGCPSTFSAFTCRLQVSVLWLSVWASMCAGTRCTVHGRSSV